MTILSYIDLLYLQVKFLLENVCHRHFGALCQCDDAMISFVVRTNGGSPSQSVSEVPDEGNLK